LRLAIASGLALTALALAPAHSPAQSPGPEEGAPPAEDPAASFELKRARATPGLAFFDAKRKPELRYRFRADGPLDLRVEVVKGRDGKTVRRWVNRRASPGKRYLRRWNGTGERRRALPDGRYSFRVGPLGERSRLAGSIELRGVRFPVPGPHRYRGGEGDFGAPRPGRVHQGKDVWARCGSRVLAARGGTVVGEGHDPRLYGHFLVIDTLGSSADHFYVHLAGPSPAHGGERVRTGERIGAVGRSGNAQSVGCMLHFELWPRGFRRGRPADPEPHLRRWDSWS
jgi:hypothetical protein